MKYIDKKSNTNSNDRRYVNEPIEDRKLYIYCIETNTIYKGVWLCSRELNVDCHNLVGCLKGRRKSVGGYHVRYATEKEINSIIKGEEND